MKSWRGLGRTGAVLLCVLACVPARPAGGAEAVTLVLDESCYFRHYYQLDWDAISPGPLKADGEKLLGRGGLRRLQAGVRRRLKHLNIDWSAVNWRDRAVVRFVCPNAGIQSVPEAERYMNSPPPPDDWTAPDFDDSRWLRQRKPFLVGKPAVGFGVQNCGVRAACFRTRFFVPDVRQAGKLTLRLTCRGGARVFVNGTEIARAHLPKGRIAPETFADDYTLEAYVQSLDDLEKAAAGRGSDWPARLLKAARAEFEKTKVWPPARRIGAIYVAEIFGEFEQANTAHAPPGWAYAWGSEGAGTGRPAYPRHVWKRIRALRERLLGPVTIPASLLRKGQNVLAIEVRAARFHPVVLMGDGWFGGHNNSWPHVQITDLALRATGKVPSMLRRPAGVQVWTEDPHHQVHDTEWGDRRGKCRTVRFVAVPNGTCGGQVVVGTDREIRGLSVTASPLKSDSGAVLPAAALTVLPMRPVPLSRLSSTVGGRSKTASDPMVGAFISLDRHGLAETARLPRDERVKMLEKLHVFDQIAAGPAAGRATIPADRCRPVWLSLKVPPDAAPGVYRGTVTVQAEGVAPVPVPLEAEVHAFRLPPPKDFAVVSALEFSPYAVAKQYNTPLWSDEHLRRLAPTLKLLSRVGNGFVFVPVISWTEFGNRDDSCIRWIRKKDGSLAWDYSRLDRFLDLCAEHMGELRCVTFVVMNGNPSNPGEVMVTDETTGRREVLVLQGKEITEPERRSIWGAFAVDLYNHMKARGQHEAMYWGYAWDSEGDPMLKNLLTEYTPGVYWAMGGHDIRVDPRFYKVTSWIYKVYGAMSLVNNRQGWKNPALEFQNPRGGGSVLCLPGPFPPFAYRLAVDRAITVGCRGVGRVGVDYWLDTYYEGARGGEVWCQPGMPVHAIFWPGPDGAESSTRFEAMAEGVQEAEARIFIEQALDRSTALAAGRKALPADLAKKAERAILQHLAATSFIPAGVPAERNIEYGATGWQERSRSLYATAAEVADFLKLDTAETALSADLAPRSKPRLALRLRNWTAKQRAFKASADQPWIVLDKPHAAAPPGFSALTVTLDGFAVKPDSQAKGTITLTDAATGRSFAVAVTARVSPVFTVSADRMVFNATTGKTDSRQFALFNASGEEIAWKATSDAPWLAVTGDPKREGAPAPAEGKLPAASGCLITVTAAPKAESATAKVTVSSPGAAEGVIAVKAFAIPPYAPPALPEGEAVPAEKLDMDKFLKRHQMLAAGGGSVSQLYFRNERRYKTPQIGEGYFAPRVYLKDVVKVHKTPPLKTAMWIKPRGEIAFNVAGAGFRAFSASVGVPPGIMADATMNFEIHVDGKLRAQSNLMTVRDAPRLLVVTGLTKASEVLLVTRLAGLTDDDRVTAFWADPRFYR